MQDSLLVLEVYNTLFLESLVSRNLTYPASRLRDSNYVRSSSDFSSIRKGVQKTGGSSEAGTALSLTCYDAHVHAC
jgi:hypothetical protein